MSNKGNLLLINFWNSSFVCGFLNKSEFIKGFNLSSQYSTPKLPKSLELIILFFLKYWFNSSIVLI